MGEPDTEKNKPFLPSILNPVPPLLEARGGLQDFASERLRERRANAPRPSVSRRPVETSEEASGTAAGDASFIVKGSEVKLYIVSVSSPVPLASSSKEVGVNVAVLLTFSVPVKGIDSSTATSLKKQRHKCEFAGVSVAQANRNSVKLY